MTTIIGTCGKGGTGKTTITALLLKYLLKKNITPILVVDADPNANLAQLLGLSSGRDVGAICDGLLEETRKNPAFLNKPDLLRLGLEESILEEEGYDLLTMGRPEGPGCYCYPNQILRTILEKISGQYAANSVYIRGSGIFRRSARGRAQPGKPGLRSVPAYERLPAGAIARSGPSRCGCRARRRRG